MVTLKDIAEKTGLSVGAVSQLLNSSDTRYARETKRRVEQVARELGYVPNRSAQVLSKRKSETIGVIDSGGLQPLSSQRTFHVARAIHGQNYRPLVYDVAWMYGDGREVCRAMIEAAVDGVILVNPSLRFSRQGLVDLINAGIPVVSNGGARLKGIPKYLSDKTYGFHLLTTHLLRSGYRRITLSVGWSSTKRDRDSEWHTNGAIEGFNKAVAEWSQREPVEADIDLTPFRRAERNPASDPLAVPDPYARGLLAMRRILQRKTIPEAVICSNDSWALGALRACREQQLRVPEDIAITGFEDELMGRYGLLPLTTVAHPIENIAERAVARLFELMQAGANGNEDELHVMRGRLIVRDSCGTIANQVGQPSHDQSPEAEPDAHKATF